MATELPKMSRESLVKATHVDRASLTGRLALLYEWIAEQDRVRIADLFRRALKQGKVYGKRPDNHIQWDVRQLVRLGAARVVPERRAIDSRRVLGIEIRGERLGLYVPSGHLPPIAHAADSFRLVDERRQFVPATARERKRYRRIVRSESVAA